MTPHELIAADAATETEPPDAPPPPKERLRVDALAADDPRAAVIPHLTMGARGPRPSVGNIATILARDPRCAGMVACDEFANCTIIRREIPQRDEDRMSRPVGSAWADGDSARFGAWAEREYGLTATTATIDEAIEMVAASRGFHPVRAYLNALEWDQTPRLDLFFSTFCSVGESPYARGVARLVFLPAVARIYEPGCKHDCVPILEGDQGQLKSSLVRTLFEPWYADTPFALGDKDAFLALRGAWGYELSELSSLKGREASRVKSFASSAVDTYRPPYGRRTISIPRQCTFIGTTNEHEYLHDATGARRFWPIRIGRIDLDAVRRDRDHLWAEAVYLYKSGAPWWPSDELTALGRREQASRREADAWEETIATTLRKRRGGITIAELLSTAPLNIEPARQTSAHTQRAATVLRQLGWVRGTQQRIGGRIVRLWTPPTSPRSVDGEPLMTAQ